MGQGTSDEREESGRSTQTLPSFGKPPVIETVLSIQFEPLPGFTNAHLGAFWDAIGGRDKWPRVTDATAVESEFERFGEERKWIPINAMRLFGPLMSARIQLSRDDRMVQIQNSRIIYNWIRTDGGGAYPRYKVLRPEFDSIFSAFKRFASDHSLGSVQPNQWEVTYINHLPHGAIWKDPSDWNKVFNASAMLPSSVAGTNLEDFSGRWSYGVPERRARLHVALNHGLEKPGGQELLTLNLTARGAMADGDGSSPTPEDGLDFGRSLIVRSFAELTSPEARSHWKQQEEKR